LSYSRLVKINDALEVEPDLSDGWTYDIDSRIFKFRLKSGLTFHDGSPVGADDVIFSFHEWAKKDALDSDLLLPIEGVKEFREGLSPTIRGIRKIDALGFEVTLDHWVDYFIRNLSIPRFVVFPKNFRNRSRKEYLKSPVGTGPYRLVLSQQGIKKYERFDRYHLGRPLTEKINIVRMTEAEARQAYQEGRVDNLLLYQISNADNLQTPDSVIERAANKTTILFIMSTAQPALRDRFLRQYIVQQINKKKIVDSCYPDDSIADNIIPPGLMGSRLSPAKEGPLQPKFPTSIRSFRNESSFLQIYLSEHTGNDCLKRSLAAMFRRSNIPVITASLDKMYGLLQLGNLQLWVEDFNFKNEDPIGILQYFSQTSNEYLLGYPLPALRKIFDDLGRELAPIERARKYAQIDSYLTDNYFVVPLLHSRGMAVHKKNVKGAEFLRTAKAIAGWHQVYVEK
ncbi:MAG: ABC transporter substrate-binding protein, partial [Elusimicrobia bacterium]|nr:ABC transporter substrate-binding protein [Elusimicrobiota bacterium]